MLPSATIREPANWKANSRQTIRCFFLLKDTAGLISCIQWDGVGYLNPWSSLSLQLPTTGSGQAMGLPTWKQEKPKFVKELRPNPIINPLKEGGRSQAAFKRSSYLQLSTQLHLGKVKGRWGKGLNGILPLSQFQQWETAAEKELKEKGSSSHYPIPVPRAVWGVMTVLFALARGHWVAFCSSCRPPKQFARSRLTCFQKGTKQFTDNKANRAYNTSQPPSPNQVSPQCLPAQMPTLGFHQPHWGTQDSITAAEHVSPPRPTQGESQYGGEMLSLKETWAWGRGKEGHLRSLPSATVTSPRQREEKDEWIETSWRLSPHRARLPLLFLWVSLLVPLSSLRFAR